MSVSRGRDIQRFPRLQIDAWHQNMYMFGAVILLVHHCQHVIAVWLQPGKSMLFKLE